jgi:hypothetical protein
MKVAICISGIPRNLYYTTWIKKLSQKYNVKVFVNYWCPHEDFLQHSNTPGPRDSYQFDEETYRFQNVESFFSHNDWEEMKPEFEAIYNSIDLSAKIYRRDLGIISMFYSMMKAQDLCNEYEEKNVPFDYVIRSRMDVFIRGGKFDYDLSKFDVDKKIYYPDYNHHYMNDHFAIMSSDTAKIYGNAYKETANLANTVQYWPERMLAHHLEKNGVELNILDFVGMHRFCAWTERE